MKKEIYDLEIIRLIEDAASIAKNVAIFIDYDNIFYTMKSYAVDISSTDYDLCELLNYLYGMKKIRTFRAYADFDQVGVKLKVLQTQRVQIRNVYGNGKDEKYRKNASDIELSIDAIETYYKDEDIDTYVFVTADSDMIPIMSRIMYKGKNVHLFYMEENASQIQHMPSYCDFNCDLLKLFKVDTAKSEPSYWFEAVKQMIIDWYKNEKNKDKIYGGTWLQNDIKEKFQISSKLAGDIINKMAENNIIEKSTLRDLNGYTIVEEITIDK